MERNGVLTMCLYVDDDGYGVFFGSGRVQSARREHRCYECGRTIEPGESYWWDKGTYDGYFFHHKMCAHCDGTISLGCSLTGCQRMWWWDFIHSFEEGVGFVGDIINEHELAPADRFRMLRTVIGRRKGWRRADGSLLPVPSTKEAARV